jgi:ankyrin repeat protein
MKQIKKSLIVGVCAILAAYLAVYGYRVARAERYWLLDRACAAGDASRVALLLRLGADPNGSWDTRYYIDYGWNVFEPTPPLFVAASCGRTDVVRLLLASGANPNIRAIEEMTPRDVARLEGHVAVVQAIDDAQRK